MTPEEMKRHLDVLELGARATPSEIKNAYLRLRKLYGGTSIVLDPIAEEFSDKKRSKILQEIEDAYAALLKAGREREAAPMPYAAAAPAAVGAAPKEAEPAGPPPADLVFSGPVLREVRERLGIDLLEISKLLKLRGELLRGMEEERYEILPEEIYLKVHLKNLAACLRLKPAKVVDDYIARYREWKSKR
ncbi:MAG: helix-turn-helix domain-containing protein [Acidobacteriota bacterium]|nr:helix-turn-helix domain-containing protein [Acidobacteriota bacterium]